TIDGAVNLTIPEETQSGKVFRLKGKGIKSYRDRSIGDLYCTVQIETPVSLNKKQKELLEEFEHSLNSSSKEHRPHRDNWKASVKSFFDKIGI
ncbi:MAG: molecular chaperone DnaJ, partial [Gammaproteobacteria bacterium]|nr:molecular chaperone DnaJ [Gammaproteobacteria bacterium]